jgi:hypothetical protein
MRKAPFTVAAIFGLTLAARAFAQEHDPAKHGGASHDNMSHAGHDMSTPAPDKRELVNFPPEIRDHQLRNMAEHFQALSGIIAAMGAAEYVKAAEISRTHLGVDSPAATGCKGAASGKDNMSTPSTAPNMHQMLSQHMPEGMSNLGMTMHHAADDFAMAATEAAKTGDGKPAYAALSRVTAGCIGCHEAYRTR